jgi:tetratricopeptide (TPR) repeat protein
MKPMNLLRIGLVCLFVQFLAAGAHGAPDATPPGKEAAGPDGAPPGVLPSDEEEALARRIWRQPAFQREFLGTYGARSDVEPDVSPEERALLERAIGFLVQPGGQAAARKLLEQSAGPKSSATLDFTIGNLYFQGGQPARAVTWYRRAVGKFPAFLRAHKNLGLALLRMDNHAEAIEPLARAIALGAADGMAYGLLGFAYAQTDRYAASEIAYQQAVLLQPQVTDWQIGLARCLFRLRKFEEAAALADELLRREPDRAEYWALEANAWLGMKQPLRAAEIFELMDLNGQATAEQLNTLGDIYTNERLTDMAADAYLRAHTRGGAAKESRLLRAAEVLALRSAPDDAGRLVARLREGDVKQMDEGDALRLLKLDARLAAARGAADEEQIRLLEEIVRQEPLDGETLILLGQRCAAADPERAILCFERAAGIEAFTAEACLRHGQLLVRQRKYAAAMPLLKRSNDLRPRDDIVRYMEQVERLARPRS